MSSLTDARPQSGLNGGVAFCIEELPEYTPKPLCTSIVPELWRQEPIRARVQNPNCTFGTFINGSVQITPQQTLRPTEIKLEILSRERSGSYGEPAPLVLRRVIACSRIPIDTPFYAGYSYKIPFSIKFPEQDWLDSCKCGKGHDTLPPSLGVHKLNIPLKCDCSYNLKISATGHFCSVYTALQFTPIHVYHPNDKEFSTSYPLKKSLKLAYKSPGRVIAHRSYLHHSGDLNEPLRYRVNLYYIPQNRQYPPPISQLEYEVVRCVFWSKAVIEFLETPQKEQVLKRGKMDLACHWENDRHTEIQVDLSLAECQIPLEPTYTGCLTAIRYKLVVIINGIHISQPLAIGGLATRPGAA